MINKDELLKIVERIEQNTASDHDIHLYNVWCKSFQKNVEELPDFDEKKEMMFREINRKIDSKPYNIRMWARVAAAAVLLLVGISFFFKNQYVPSGKHFDTAARAVKEHGISPEANRATLILADGKNIILSSSGEGEIIKDQGQILARTTDSSIVYNQSLGIMSMFNRRSSVPGSILFNTLLTAQAQQYQLVLPDGSKVWLNAATSLKFPVSFEGLSERRVELDGEAYFEVAKDVARPFIVHSHKQDVRVLGTHFNINSYHDEPTVRTTLLEGSVNVNGTLTLRPGEQAMLHKNGKMAVEKVNAAAFIAWKKGYFEFNNENIYEIMRRISRWYDVEVIYEGHLPLEGMEGSMSRFKNVSEVLSIMESTRLVKFRIDGKKIYVKKYK